MPEKVPRICLVACEASGDLLAAKLATALTEAIPGVELAGVAGEHMRNAGVRAWHDVSEISVMGIAEVLKHLPRLRKLRKQVLAEAEAWGADILIGVDGPDFNIGLERMAKQKGMKTVHYVSPSIWAWREGRAAKLKEATDLVLCLFPMEPPIYDRYGARSTFVGHPLADSFDIVPDQLGARSELGLPADAQILGILPGSRISEITKLGAIFVAAAARLRRQLPGLLMVAPMANARCKEAFGQILRSGVPEGLDPDEGAITEAEWRAACDVVSLVDGQSHQVMLASDQLLLASGTAALEGLLAKRPMVVAYRIAPLTHAIVKGLGILKVDRYSLPNILSGRRLVPELMQDDCRPAPIAEELTRLMTDHADREALLSEFTQIHQTLKKDSAAVAAQAVKGLLGG